MATQSGNIAVVFDFDDTLVPDSTTSFLVQKGLDPKKFWTQDLKRLVVSGYDPTLGFLKLFLDRVGAGRPFGQLSNADLRAFGKTLRPYPGLTGLLRDLRAIGTKYRIGVDFYVISGGRREIILGSSIAKHFAAIYGCEFAEEGTPPVINNVKRAINFTEKTRYLFEIHKGLDPVETAKNPYLVNKEVLERPIPLENIIYVGDGLTDIPCFSLLKKHRGLGFGVFDPKNKDSAKRALEQFLMPHRVVSMHAPKYGPNDELGSFIRAAVTGRCSAILVRRGTPKPDSCLRDKLLVCVAGPLAFAWPRLGSASAAGGIQ